MAQFISDETKKQIIEDAVNIHDNEGKALSEICNQLAPKYGCHPATIKLTVQHVIKPRKWKNITPEEEQQIVDWYNECDKPKHSTKVQYAANKANRSHITIKSILARVKHLCSDIPAKKGTKERMFNYKAFPF